ncbi:hypothetical protein WR25_05411 isoform D [Diploscapter pachys]|uniref:PLD phosphodiesterase domain-containing protein n=1 Tax=Diploscapter pachys TaxID=2018661 RepID=A0A2A2KA65_9BILA|nr:hypothetical protein WR25_05411 isoform D [Diploscapter pachys]
MCDEKDPYAKCGKPDEFKCPDTCEIVICESIPAGLVFDSKYPIFNKTTDCWLRLLNEAQNEVTIASFYWSLLVEDTGDNYTTDSTNTSMDGKQIYDQILATANRGVNFRIAQTYNQGGYAETENLMQASNGRIQVRSLDFKNWYPGGILHTKSWSVDGKHIYIGSANFDWRSLTQVKELGIAAYNCPCLGQDLQNLLEIYWQMGAPGAKFPDLWPENLSTPATHETPTFVPQKYGNQAMYITASPPGFKACGREDDLQAMIKVLDSAQEYAYLAVMDYSPATLYMGDNNNKWLPEFDNAIRRAAFERQVTVRFMLSRWPHTYNEFYGYMHSLASISETLPYHWDNRKRTKKGSIDVKFIEVPTMQYGDIPFGRVYHNKYFVTESSAYIGINYF